MANLRLFFENNNTNADEFKQLMFDAAHNTLQVGLTQKAASSKIREAMFSVMEIEPTNNLKVVRRAFARHKLDVYEILEETVESKLVSGWKDSEWFQEFVDMRNLAEGDDNEFYSKKEVYLTVSKVSKAANHDISVQRLGEGDVFTVKTNRYAAAVGTDIELFLLGKRDWNELIDAIVKAFDTLIKNTMYAEVINVGAKLPANSQFHKNGAIAAATKDTFDLLIEDVSAANDNVPVVIMGTRSALAKLEKLVEVDWVSNEMKNEKNKTGRVGYYQGNVLTEIPQRFAPGDTTVKLVDNKKLLIMPNDMDKFVKFVDVGDGEITEVTEKGANVTDAMKYQYERTMGISTLIGKYFGVWDITE